MSTVGPSNPSDYNLSLEEAEKPLSEEWYQAHRVGATVSTNESPDWDPPTTPGVILKPVQPNVYNKPDAVSEFRYMASQGFDDIHGMYSIEPDFWMKIVDSPFMAIAIEMGDLVTKKNKAYGDSFATAGEFLKLLYPHGAKPDQFNDMLAFARMFDKMARIATDKDAFGEDPARDLVGYSLLMVAYHEALKEKANADTKSGD
jgi:hypothetical protein